MTAHTHDPHIALDDVYDGFRIAMLWATNDDNGDPLDSNYSRDDLAPEALIAIEKLCDGFIAANKENCIIYFENMEHVRHRGEGTAWDYFGHDLFLSSNGHGAGFFDRQDVPKEVRDELQDAARGLGETNAYVGDDGQIHI